MAQKGIRRVRKAVFPVAGLGTRFLPATKAVPKEMLTVVDRPVLQHVVDEARQAGIEHFIFVTGRNKATIEDYFDRHFELERTLEARKKKSELELLSSIQLPAGATSFTRQQEPLGLGHAVWCARDIVGDEPFALLLPDMIVQPGKGGRGCLAEMMDVYRRTGGNIIAVEEVPPEDAHKFGIVAIGKGKAPLWPIEAMVEKPPKGTAPSNLYIMGRYIIQPEIFPLLGTQQAGAGGEIQVTDALIALKDKVKQPFHALRHSGRTFDCGSKIGFLAANLALGLDDKDAGQELKALITKMM